MFENGNGANVKGKTVLAFEYDHETHQVSIGGDSMPLTLAQMICDEGGRLLVEKRRVAATMELARQMAEQARAREIANRVGGGRH